MTLPKGVAAALVAAVLFGASTPLAKTLVGEVAPVLLAGLLYVGSGAGLWIVRWFGGGERSAFSRAELPWLAGAVLSGGVLGPILLMAGLRSASAAQASLLLNLESVFTAGLAWFVFRENVGRRVAVGMAFIVAGGTLLSWQPGQAWGLSGGAVAVVAACACWAIDNNLTQRISAADPVQVAATKGTIAGAINVAIGWTAGATWPASKPLAAALLVGFVGYGVSLVLYVIALRHVGTARSGAYFSAAPFVGAAVSVVLLKEPASPMLGASAALMAIGLWLHLTERHEHEHDHEPVTHEHRHAHDAHHAHDHDSSVPPGEPHAHVHTHARVVHKHPHYPDVQHRHRH